MTARLRLTRTVSFSAAHRYHDQGVSDQINRERFGSLWNAAGYGHNFLLEASFEGSLDPLTGMIVDLALVDAWLKDVADLFDHRHLNELAIFNGRAPTPERIAKAFFDELAKRAGAAARVVKLRLREGDGLWIDYEP